MAFVVESGVPPEVIKGYLHRLCQRRCVLHEERAPCVSVIVFQAGGILTAQRIDDGPHISFMGFQFRHCRSEIYGSGGTEQAVCSSLLHTGAGSNVLHIPALRIYFVEIGIEYNAYVQERLENTGRVVGAFDIDLDAGRFDALHIMDGWQCFRVQDISSAVYFAMKKSGVRQEERWKVFLDRLDGKQLLRETEPGYLTGSRMLRAEEICFSEDIVQNGKLLEFCLDGAIDVDKMFGTNTCDYDNGDWFNIYANYDMEAHRVCDTLEVYLQHEDGGEQEFKYRLSEEEQALLLPRMEDYCQQQWGQSLEECCADYLAEQDQAPQGMQM